MADAKVLVFRMNDASLKRKIAELAKDSARIFVPYHARQQMRKRRILLTQIQAVLIRGSIVEHAHRDIHGCWRCTLHLTIAGDSIRVAAALGEDEFRNKIIVITVMR